MKRERQYTATFGAAAGRVVRLTFNAEGAQLARDHAAHVARCEGGLVVLHVKRLAKHEEAEPDTLGTLRPG